MEEEIKMLSVETSPTLISPSSPYIPPELEGDEALSGRNFILTIEDTYNRYTADIVQKNPFWAALMNDPVAVLDRVYHGLCIENYHLLFRESYFDSPILPYSANRRVRELVNEFYVEELGHDKLLLKSLNSIGLSEQELFETIPLSGTMALCNALSYWARNDPLFFFTTLGPLEGREVEIDSFVTAAHKKGLPEALVGPIAAHANINKTAEHGALTREIFENIPEISAHDARRMCREARQFALIYDRFYRCIWQHYNSPAPLIRRIADFY